jgi:tRNA 2-thiouridine synthesizing protein A
MAAPSRPGTATDPVVAQPIGPDKSIDCIGLYCPIPILKTRQAMKSLAVAQILEMLSDDPGSDPDMKSWAQRTGNELVEISRNEAVYRFFVRKVRKDQLLLDQNSSSLRAVTGRRLRNN